MSKPDAACVDFPDETITLLDNALRPVLFRYLAGNSRWEIREKGNLKYAVRRELVDGHYQTTLNGFYSAFEGDEVRQSRVILAFGSPYGFGRDRGNITRVVPGSKEVHLIVEGEHSGTPGNSSYVIIDGQGIFLEIYDQAPELERKFTKAAFAEVSAELKDVLGHIEEIRRTGVLPVADRYPGPISNKTSLLVKDGMQPGIYLLEAAINPATSGFAYTRAYNAETGERLSEERITERSTRYVGWSRDGKTFFPYNSEITVYEGDWDNTYEARFELWHRSETNTEIKMAEITRLINGWQR